MKNTTVAGIIQTVICEVKWSLVCLSHLSDGASGDSNHHPLHNTILRFLSVPDLELVLTNPLLKLQSKDQLYEVIVSLADEKGDDALVLLRYVPFAFLSEQDSTEARGKQRCCLEEGV